MPEVLGVENSSFIFAIYAFILYCRIKMKVPQTGKKTQFVTTPRCLVRFETQERVLSPQISKLNLDRELPQFTRDDGNPTSQSVWRTACFATEGKMYSCILPGSP